MGDFDSWFNTELRKNRLSQRQFAELAGVSKSAVGAWANGDRVPDPENCRKIADTLDLGWDEVLTRAGHRSDTGEFPIDDPRQRAIDLIEELDPSDPATRFWLEMIPPTVEKLKRLDGERRRSQ